MISLSLSGIKKEYDMEENFVCQVCVFILANVRDILIDKISKFLSSKNNNPQFKLITNYRILFYYYPTLNSHFGNVNRLNSKSSTKHRRRIMTTIV